MMRSSASLALALAALLALGSGCATAPSAPADSPACYQDTTPPPGWRDPSVGKETRSGGMVATGVVLISLGATMLPFGSLISAGAGRDCDFDEVGNTRSCKTSSENLSGIGMLVAGAGGLAV